MKKYIFADLGSKVYLIREALFYDQGSTGTMRADVVKCICIIMPWEPKKA